MTPVLHARALRYPPRAGFTLIEIMVVVAVIGLIAVFSIPAIREATHREAMTQAIHDLSDACGTARARAILDGNPTEVRIRTADRTIEVGNAPADATPAFDFGPNPGSAPKAPKTQSSSGRIPDNLIIRMLDVNLVEYKDEPEARIRFFPNGTCDEFTMILDAPGGESRTLSLEVVTGLLVPGLTK